LDLLREPTKGRDKVARFQNIGKRAIIGSEVVETPFRLAAPTLPFCFNKRKAIVFQN
jgi:hypothetical protein